MVPGAGVIVRRSTNGACRRAQSLNSPVVEPRARRMARLLADACPPASPPRPPADRRAGPADLELRGASAPGRRAARNDAYEGHRRQPAAVAEWPFEGRRRARAQGL